MKKVLSLSLILTLMFCNVPVHAFEVDQQSLSDAHVSENLDAVDNEENSLKINSIVAKTRIGANDKEVYSFIVTVNDASLIKDLKAEDFDITGNKSSTVFDVETGTWCEDYKNDELAISISDNVITMNFKQFVYGNDWNVTCHKLTHLSFTAKDVSKVNTSILDEAVRGKITYAGLTREYALYVPSDATGPVPLVIWNHGGGEYAIDLETNLTKNRGLTAWPEEGYQTAVLMIQVANENYSYGASESEEKKKLIDQNNALQAALVRQLINKNIVDKNRVYVTGASSGGGATMRFLMQYPEMFAGAIACCSMDPIVPVHNQSFAVIGKEKDSFETIVSHFEDAFQDKV
ncbi:MAG: prolyl oligopeptidase family serine peptidase, partial [Faecalibacillus sp.]